MPTRKRAFLGRGKGYLPAAGSQYRFIIFLLIVLGIYTFLLKVFQKISEFMQLPLFLPIALITLLIFISVVGTMYSHTFIGPMIRIRRTLEHLAEGDAGVSLRLRESDDPILKELVQAITRVCEHSRHSHALIQEYASDLFKDVTILREKCQKGADANEIGTLIEGMGKKHDLLDNAIKKSHRK